MDRKKLVASSGQLVTGKQRDKKRIHKVIKDLCEVQTWWQSKAMISVTPVHPDGNGNEE